MEYMLGKRTTSKVNLTEIDQIIRHFYFSQNIAENQILISKLNSPELSQHFTNLHLYLSQKSLIHLQRFQILTDGIYILLKGQVGFRISDVNHQKDVMKKSKGSNFFKNPSSVILNNAWTVFQTSCKNCTAYEQSYLLFISEQQAVLSGFYQKSALRKDLYDNRYVPADQECSLDQSVPNFNTNIRIHSHFIFKTFYFREIINLESLAIVHIGRARFKNQRGFSGQFGKYAILMPQHKYQVTTAQIQILILAKNQSYSYGHSTQLSDIVANNSPILTPVSSIHKQKSMDKSLHSSVCSPMRQQFIPNKEIRQKRRKDLVKISKDAESYSIISSYLFHTNLKYVKNHNSTHNLKQKKQNRCKHPLVLFKVSNSKPNLVMPSFEQPRTNQEEVKSKYISAHKVSTQSESSPITLLKKVGLPLDQQRKFISKHHYRLNHTLRCKQSAQIAIQQQEEIFKPYNRK